MKKTLLVEDDPKLLRIYSRFLSSENYIVTACSSAAEAVGRIRSESFDLLITDYHLGKQTGAGLIWLIKAVNPLAKALIITGDEKLAGTRGPGPAYADADTLIKPFKMDDLLNVVHNLLEARPLAARGEPS